jgi:hypothetical protein
MAHPRGGDVQVRAGSQHLFELELLFGVEVLGTAQQPGSDLADLGTAGVGGGAAPSARNGAR